MTEFGRRLLAAINNNDGAEVDSIISMLAKKDDLAMITTAVNGTIGEIEDDIKIMNGELKYVSATVAEITEDVSTESDDIAVTQFACIQEIAGRKYPFYITRDSGVGTGFQDNKTTHVLGVAFPAPSWFSFDETQIQYAVLEMPSMSYGGAGLVKHDGSYAHYKTKTVFSLADDGDNSYGNCLVSWEVTRDITGRYYFNVGFEGAMEASFTYVLVYYYLLGTLNAEHWKYHDVQVNTRTIMTLHSPTNHHHAITVKIDNDTAGVVENVATKKATGFSKFLNYVDDLTGLPATDIVESIKNGDFGGFVNAVSDSIPRIVEIGETIGELLLFFL